jgi:hypothetical protein
MSDQRISGQDTEVTIVTDGTPVANIRAVKSFEVTWKFTLKTEEYLGETQPRNDDFFEGLSGRIEIDAEGTDVLTLVQVIQARAQSRSINTRIGIKTTLQFPNGERAIVNINNVFFSDIPLSFGGRTEYGKITLSWQADNGRIVSR